VETATDMIYRGYDSERAMAFAKCVVDLMYPDPEKN
jgi:hypothetical protein